MQAKQYWNIFMCTVVFSVLSIQCTQNPIFEDNIIPVEKRWIRGRVKLDDGMPAKGAAVWYSGYDVGCYTNNEGVFDLVIPGGGSQSGAAETGVYPLYVYINNYRFQRFNVFIQNGKVVDGQGDIGHDGWIEDTIILESLATVSTESYYWYDISSNDSCVAFKTQCLIKKPPVTFLLRNRRLSSFFLFPDQIEGQEILIKDNSQIPLSQMRVNQNEWNGGQSISLNGGVLKPGFYEYVPWLIVYQPDLPSGLKRFIGYDFESVDMSYLKLPFVRSGGYFELFKEDDFYNVLVRQKTDD